MEFRALRYFVAVVEERNIGRAASRLYMTQPPLSRAIRAVERDLGVDLLLRTPAGVEPTPAGAVLYEEARRLFEQIDTVRARVATAGARLSMTVGLLAGTVDKHRDHLAADFRRLHPDVFVQVREADLSDPTAGLRSAAVDVAITRSPFDSAGLSTRLLRTDAVSAVLRADDPLAGPGRIALADLADRTWFRFPPGTDPAWTSFWHADGHSGPLVRTVAECFQAVLWNDAVGLSPVGHRLPDGLVMVPLSGQPVSPLVVAWRAGDPNPLVESFVGTVEHLHHTASGRFA